MSDAKADIVRRLYEEVWTGRNYDVATEVFHPDFSYVAAPDLRGPEAKLKAIRMYHDTFPDLVASVEELTAGESSVAARVTVSGTDKGGLRGKPATGKSVSFWLVEFFEFRDGLIIGNWVGADWLGLLIQQEAIPNPWA